MDDGRRKAMLGSLISGPALQKAAWPEAGESDPPEEFVPYRSALYGIRMALPIALCLWVLIAAMIWAWHR